ncbi:YadA-like family protein [Histophilus somni]|uniref:YadA-like family protein n=1 Tax=Histophilus somni TaxID=731 RepID=UPI0018EE0064|nr:YadA-like family protein [Histophilus somni]QQF84987.1 YadA-like family protein [Histophilus somni]
MTASAVKNYVTTKFGALSSTLNLETDQPTDGSKNKGSINLKSDTLKITGDSNITTSLDTSKKNISIKLKENLTYISSIGNGNSTKITFDDSKKEIKLGSVSVSVNSEHKIVIGEGSKSDSQHTLAIGNKAIIGQNAKGSISIASLTNGEQGNISNAEWAVSIGNKNSITGGNDIVALGSNINVSGSDGKSKSVVAIGNGTQVTNGKESIAIGVAGNTKIESAEWAVAIGNNTKVSGGNDILALGSNISITGSNNGSVVVLGNGAKASAAENSVVIGKGAESKAQSAVVIGEGATVEGDAGDSVALGKNSKAKTKKLAPSGLDGNVGTNSLKISWTAGVSSGDMDKKSVFSIGDANSERIITNVAAGTVDNSSTDAINGGQLKSVIDVFGKLAFDVLGAEKETEKEADKQTVKDGFKKSTFTAVQYKRDPQPQGQPQQQAKVPMTFREAINESIAAINKGLIFKGDMPSAVTNGTQNTPHYLGSTIQIVRLATPANTGTTTTQPATTTPAITAYSGENLITQYSNTNGNAKIEIGFKNAPTFSKVMLAKEQTYNGGSGTGGSTDWKKELITKGYLEQALDKFKFKVSTGEGDDKTFEIGRGDTLKFTSGQNIQLTLAKQDGATSGSSASAAGSGDASMATTGTAPSTPTSTTSDTSTGSAGGTGARATGEVAKLTIEAEKGATFQVGSQGAKVNINEEEKKVVIKAEPSTAPIGISNVASGLGLEAQTEEEKKKTQEKSAELTKAVEEKVKAVSKEAKALSDKAQTFTDLALAVSSLEQAINALPEGNDKTQAEAKLKENQMKLDEAKKALEQARNDLKEAQTGLTKAEEAYEQNYKGYEKVVELVKPKPDSSAELTNVATIGDLQAVAKSGMKFKGNDGVELRKQLSETLEIKGEGEFNSDRTATGNIKVEMSQDGKGLEVKLSDQLKNMTSFETREVEGRKSTLNSNGLIVVNKGADNKVKSATYGAEAMVLSNQENGNKAVVTAGGVHFATTQAPATGARAGTGVITGLKDLDARSTGDMATNKNYVDEKVGSAVNRLDNAISTTNRRLQAGIAGALATGGLPITVMPGKSMLAASAGSYKGQSAVALGYSRMSDNGKIMLRLQGTSTSTGDVGGSVGVGYQW